MTTFLPSFCYCLSVFLTTEYHLPLEVHESLNRIFPVFMRVSGDTEISLPHFRAHTFATHKIIKLLIYAALHRLYLKSDHVFDTVEFVFITVCKHGQAVVSYIFETY